RSPFKGFSVEFAEYRQYIHGDDLSTIDWKVYARTDRHYIKKFEEETNLNCHLMLDISGSMAYGSRGITKHEYGLCLAASLAYLILDPDEIEFPFERATRFEDLETSEEVMAVPGAVRAHYLKEIGSLIDRYKRELGSAGIDYHLLSTAEPLEMALLSYLSTRAKML